MFTPTCMCPSMSLKVGTLGVDFIAVGKIAAVRSSSFLRRWWTRSQGVLQGVSCGGRGGGQGW